MWVAGVGVGKVWVNVVGKKKYRKNNKIIIINRTKL